MSGRGELRLPLFIVTHIASEEKRETKGDTV